MDNWLLIIVAVIFIICIVVGYVRGFLKLGISLLSSNPYPGSCAVSVAFCCGRAGKIYADGRLYRKRHC